MERYRYDAYGAATVLDADGSDDSDGLSDVENPYAFTARRLDAETDLMYYRNRQYSVALGRFISRDPAGYGEAVLLYGYVGGRPTVNRDPKGLYIYDGPVVASATAGALDERYASSNYHWGHAHCTQMCMIASLSSMVDAVVIALGKEVYDQIRCENTGHPGSCYSANQDSDWEANGTGWRAPMHAPCEIIRNDKEAQASPAAHDCWDECFDACVTYCEGMSWGPDIGATAPGEMGAERGYNKEDDGYLDFRWPERKRKEGNW
ncbi:MAG: RHS repeat-associated core domain-containing protein [Candidatus Brocadiia bacterium]